jgi:hypothetical protein
MCLGTFWQEKLQTARQERVQLSERWVDSLKAFLGDDAALVRLCGEQPKGVGQFSQVVEALPDDVWATRRRKAIGSSPSRGTMRAILSGLGRERHFPCSRVLVCSENCPFASRPESFKPLLARSSGVFPRSQTTPRPHPPNAIRRSCRYLRQQGCRGKGRRSPSSREARRFNTSLSPPRVGGRFSSRPSPSLFRHNLPLQAAGTCRGSDAV